jgi:hypothetical protein
LLPYTDGIFHESVPFLVKEGFKVKKDGNIIMDVGYSTSSVVKLTELAEIRSNV